MRELELAGSVAGYTASRPPDSRKEVQLGDSFPVLFFVFFCWSSIINFGRLKKELLMAQQHTDYGIISANLVNETNIFKWEAKIAGPEGTITLH